MSSIVQNNSNTIFTVLETSSATCAEEQEVHDLLEFLKLEYRKNIQYKVLLNILEEYVQEDSSENKPLKEKIKNIILSHNVSQTLLLDSSTTLNSGTSLLGIQHRSLVSLNYLERNTLQEILKSKVEEKADILHKSLSKTDKENLTKDTEKSYIASLQLSSEERVLFNTKEKLISEQEEYVKNLMELQKVLVEISELRLKKLPNEVEYKVKHTQTRDEINNLKACFTEKKFRVDIFTETSCSLQAYKELVKDIKKQQVALQKEIEEFEDMKEKYKQVTCKQFKDMLTSYSQYKSSLEKRKKLQHFVT